MAFIAASAVVGSFAEFAAAGAALCAALGVVAATGEDVCVKARVFAEKCGELIECLRQPQDSNKDGRVYQTINGKVVEVLLLHDIPATQHSTPAIKDKTAAH